MISRRFMNIDKNLLAQLLGQAAENPRLRQNLDLRTSGEDGSQRMLNALMPGTKVAVHRHPNSSETVVCLQGRLDEILYEEVKGEAYAQTGETLPDLEVRDGMRSVSLREKRRIHLNPSEGMYGCQVPKGVWHTVEVLEPSVIFEAKDGAYGGDGSEIF